MSQPGDIGAARISLVVDASDYESSLNRLKNTAADFGKAAEAAFDRATGKSRTAANRLLDYVATLGRAESALERMVRQASRAGVEAPVIAAAVNEWKKYQAQLQAVETQQRQVNAAFDEASKINVAFDADRGARSQADVNRTLGVTERDAATQAQRRADAEAAILPLLQRQERELEQQLALAHQINNARNEHVASSGQQQINSLLGVQTAPRDAGYLAEQRRVVGVFQEQAAAEAAVEAEARAIHAQWVAIERQVTAATTKLSSYDIARANAVQQFGKEGAAPLVKQIDQFEKLNTSIHGTTVNTNQLRQAIRFLPAQFTDIGVSLAGGMNPLLVALQQGGQIFNQFGLAGAGVKQTLQEIGKYALGLVNPMVVAGVAVAGLAYAGYDAAKALEDLSVASAKGFGVAGSAEDLYALTESLNQLQNVRLGPAEDAVARLAAGGRLAGDNFTLAAEATARWSSITGEAVDRVAGQFEAIGKDPLQAIESGTIRVTQAQYDVVKALVAVGDEQGAVTALTKIWYDTINGQSGQVEAHLAGVSRLMQSIKDDFGEAARGAGEFFNEIIDKVGVAKSKLALLAGPLLLLGGAGLPGLINGLSSPDAPKPKAGQGYQGPLADPAATKRVKAAADELATYLATADEKAQRRITINRIVEDGKRLHVDALTTAGIIDKQEKLWKDADAKKNKSKSGGRGGASSASRDVRYDYQLESALLQTQGREVQAQYAAKKISAEAYYGSLLKLAQQEYDIQKRSNAEQLGAIGGKKGQEHEVARLRVADALAEQTLAQRTIDINSQQAQYLTQLDQERRAYNNTLRDGVQAQQEEYDIALNRATMGGQEFERWNAEAELRKDEARQLRDIRRQVEDKTITVTTGAEREQAAIQATNDKLAQTVAMYARLDAATADWSVGVNKAWSDWQTKVADTSGAAEKFTTEALQGFADQTTNALTGAETSWGDYFDSLARMITQFIVEEQLTKWIKSLSGAASGGGSSGGGGGWGSIIGSMIGAFFGGGGGDAGTFAGVDITGQNFAEGGQAPANSMVGVNERGFELASIGSRQYMLTGSRPVQITPNHKISAPATSTRPAIITQTFVVQGTPDRSTRDQMRRDIANATQRSVAKV